jgi:PhnB protein
MDNRQERIMKLNPHLSFNGQCEAAFKFYERCLGGKIEMMVKFGETPMADQASPEWRDKLAHARLSIGDQILMGGDPPPGMYEQPKGFSVTLSVDTPAEAERIFNALAQNAEVRMPLGETFWALRFGMLIDQFGTPWMVNCERTA